MKTVIGWLAIAAVGYFVYWVVRRILHFFALRKQSPHPFSDDFVEVADDVASASRVAAALSIAAVYFIAPAGLLSIGAFFGVVPTPLIKTVLPVLVGFAAGAAALSAFVKLVAKSKSKK